jgi:hypothetical protein
MVPDHILDSECPHRTTYRNCLEVECNNHLSRVDEFGTFDNSTEAWEEDWDESPQLGGMAEELRQEYE